MGIALGLMLTFTVTIAGLASVVDGVGVADGTVRSIAIAVLIGFGVMLLWPRLAQRVEAPLYRLARFGPRTRGDGFWSGVAVGGALGFLYAPCAGPILAAVVSVSATHGQLAGDPRDRARLQRRVRGGAAGARARRAPDDRAHPVGGPRTGACSARWER